MSRVPVVMEHEFTPDYATLYARLVGVTPLLMHSPAGMVRGSDTDVKKAGKNIPSAEDEAELGAYRDAKGQLAMPEKNVRRAIVEGGSFLQDPTNPRAKLKKLFGGSVLPGDLSHFAMLDPKTNKPLKTYEVDIQRVVIMRAGIMRARPRFDEWAIQIEIMYDRGLIKDPAWLGHGLGLAGQKIGLGDWRPEKGGSYGRFIVEDLQVDAD
jgi:hypothetical protein